MQCVFQNSFYTNEHNTKQTLELVIHEKKAEIGNSGRQTDYFLMIVHNFSFPVKRAIIYTHHFCLMLVLVISQIKTSIVFVFNLKLFIFSGVTRIICKQIWFLKISGSLIPVRQCPGRSWSFSGPILVVVACRLSQKCHTIYGKVYYSLRTFYIILPW